MLLLFEGVADKAVVKVVKVWEREEEEEERCRFRWRRLMSPEPCSRCCCPKKALEEVKDEELEATTLTLLLLLALTHPLPAEAPEHD